MSAREDDDDLLPVVRAADLSDAASDTRWLIEPLWTRAGVGILGGAPKCCKSWLALDAALSVASDTPCLDRFAVRDSGAVLIYMAEDADQIVKQRLASLARHRGVDLVLAHLHVITVPSIRLDTERDRHRLARTVEHYKPRLLVLDPFVRLHRSIHENDAGEVSALLAYLRDLQRAHDVAVLVVHHAKKNGTNGASAGHGLRGSGDFFAWADDLLYLQRRRDGLLLTTEHRAAAAPEPCLLALDAAVPHHAHLRLIESATDGESEPADVADLAAQILATLAATPEPITRAELRTALHVRNERLGVVLAELLATGAVVRVGDRWARAAVPVPTAT